MKTRALNEAILFGGTKGVDVVKIRPEKDFDIVIDQTDSMGYEVKKVRYLLLVPILWIMAIWTFFKKEVLGLSNRTNSLWVDGLSPLVREIKERAGSWRALDIIYNFRFAKENSLADDYWLGIVNAQGVRNRLKLVKRELKKIINELADKNEEIKILSIASGSAQAVLEALKETKDTRKDPLSFKLILLDIDPSALEYSKKLAQKYGFNDNVIFINGSTANLEKTVNGIRPNLIEMVGFLDYRPHIKAVRLIKKAYDLLSPGGKFITANICPNQEQIFMKWVIDWAMIYRKPEELGQIVIEGGFENCKIIYEPQRVHAVAISQK